MAEMKNIEENVIYTHIVGVQVKDLDKDDIPTKFRMAWQAMRLVIANEGRAAGGLVPQVVGVKMAFGQGVARNEDGDVVQGLRIDVEYFHRRAGRKE